MAVWYIQTNKLPFVDYLEYRWKMTWFSTMLSCRSEVFEP